MIQVASADTCAVRCLQSVGAPLMSELRSARRGAHALARMTVAGDRLPNDAVRRRCFKPAIQIHMHLSLNRNFQIFSNQTKRSSTLTPVLQRTQTSVNLQKYRRGPTSRAPVGPSLRTISLPPRVAADRPALGPVEWGLCNASLYLQHLPSPRPRHSSQTRLAS